VAQVASSLPRVQSRSLHTVASKATSRAKYSAPTIAHLRKCATCSRTLLCMCSRASRHFGSKRPRCLASLRTSETFRLAPLVSFSSPTLDHLFGKKASEVEPGVYQDDGTFMCARQRQTEQCTQEYTPRRPRDVISDAAWDPSSRPARPTPISAVCRSRPSVT
jgi:hypothetical protein